MSDTLTRLITCVERGKVDRDSPYPPDLAGKIGAREITRELLEAGVSADDILNKSLVVAMDRLGERFARGEAFIPDLLIAAKAMKASMELLKPYFETGKAVHRGIAVMGTVMGDLHDIGKNIVCMMLEGAGWKVIDLGINVPAKKYIEAIEANPGCIIGMSALLTTTLGNMQATVSEVKKSSPETKVFIGGSPVNSGFSEKIGADGYFPEPQSFIRYLNESS